MESGKWHEFKGKMKPGKKEIENCWILEKEIHLLLHHVLQKYRKEIKMK